MKTILAACSAGCVAGALAGGVDSVFLARVAHDVLGERPDLQTQLALLIAGVVFCLQVALVLLVVLVVVLLWDSHRVVTLSLLGAVFLLAAVAGAFASAAPFGP